MAGLLVIVMVEVEAREALEARHLGGRPNLLADSHEAWDRFAEQVDRLWSIGGTTSEPAETPEDEGDGDDPLAGRVAERVRQLADDARISTFERLGEMPRAVAIAERRIRGVAQARDEQHRHGSAGA